MVIERSSIKHCYLRIKYKKKRYELFCGHPYHMLRDETISWEAKGYLSHILLLQDDIDISKKVIVELIACGYLVEACNENPTT